MKTSTLTIRLDKDLDDLLTKASRRSRRNRSEIAREALRRQLRISQFEALRQRMMPFAEARVRGRGRWFKRKLLLTMDLGRYNFGSCQDSRDWMRLGPYIT